MIIICYGMIKSASTFVYQAVNNSYRKERGSTQNDYLTLGDISSQCKYDFVDKNVDMKKLILEIESANIDLEKEHIFVKTHMGMEFFKPIIEKFPTCCIATYRHPAEAALSLIDVAKKDKQLNRKRFDEFDTWEVASKQMKYQSQCFLSWSNHHNISKLYYDDIALKPEICIKRAVDKCGLIISVSEEITELLSNKNKITEYNKGIVGRRTKELTVDQVSEIEKALPELMNFINGESSSQ